MKVQQKVHARRTSARGHAETAATSAFLASVGCVPLGYGVAAATLFAVALGTGAWLIATRNAEERAADIEADQEASAVSF